MIEWEIRAYRKADGECPYEEFLKAIELSGQKGHVAKIKKLIEKIASEPVYRKLPFAVSIKGYDGLWEARNERDGYRVYYAVLGNTMVILDGSRKIPQRRKFNAYLETVNGYLLDYIERDAGNDY